MTDASPKDQQNRVLEIAMLQEFANTAESVAGTTKKLEKAAFLGAYLRKLIDADLTRASRYFAGQQFAQSDSRTTNVGGSIISAALSEATGFSLEDMSPRYVKLGDPGDLAAEPLLRRVAADHHPEGRSYRRGRDAQSTANAALVTRHSAAGVLKPRLAVAVA